MLKRIFILFVLSLAITASITARVPTGIGENPKDITSLNARFGTFELERLLSSLFQNPVSDRRIHQHQKHHSSKKGHSQNEAESSTKQKTTNQQGQFENGKQSLNKGRLLEEQQPDEQQAHQNQRGDEPTSILGKPVIVPTTIIPDGIVVFEDSSLETPAQRQCVQDCPSTSEYKPVCGTNNVTYFNLDKFTCARKCGERSTCLYDCLKKANLWNRCSFFL